MGGKLGENGKVMAKQCKEVSVVVMREIQFEIRDWLVKLAVRVWTTFDHACTWKNPCNPTSQKRTHLLQATQVRQVRQMRQRADKRDTLVE